MRIGQGYDVHRLAEDRSLILGGVTIPYEKGLLGHSDADVLVHAVMDALLGAAALGDIGQHFPDTDPAYKGISSIELLRRVGVCDREYRCHHYCPEAKACTVQAADGGQYGRGPPPGCGQGQRQGHHGGGAWFYRNRGRDFFSGNYLIDGTGRLLL